MQEKETKNYGCVPVIIFLVIAYAVLSLLVRTTDTLGKILENPFINYGIPVFILFIIYLRTKNDDKEK